MIKSIIYTALIAATVVATSCRKKGCTNEEASNYDTEAKKDDGSCIFDPRDEYLGSYVVTDSSFGDGTFISTINYTLVVDKGSTVSDTIYLNNWRNTGDNYPAFLTGSSFTAPDNGNPENGGISGSGSFEENSISYTANTVGGSFETRGKGTN
ncbi:MAG: hypothetical protein GQ574_11020 [Crocinitomix sp.]|nr:hypothetical protein [Crocinitomix sp.]